MSYRESVNLDTSTDPPIGAGRRWYGILRARMKRMKIVFEVGLFVAAIALVVGGLIGTCHHQRQLRHDAFPRDVVAIIDTGKAFNDDMTKAYADDTTGCWVFHGDAVPEMDESKFTLQRFFDFRDSHGVPHRIDVHDVNFTKRYPNEQAFLAENPDTSRCDQVKPSWNGGQDNRP